MDQVAAICSVFPYTVDECFDLDYDRIDRLYEIACRRQYEAQRRMTIAVAQGIGLAFDKNAKEPPTWDDLKEQARQRERTSRSVFVIKGRQSLAGTATGTPDSG